MTETAVDLDSVAALYDRQCASEPIHRLGGVQPNGFLLVVDPGSGLIIQVSAGVTRHWPGIADPAALLGTRLETWVAPTAVPLGVMLQALPLLASPVLLGLALRDLAPAAVGSAPVLRGFECMGHAVGAHAVLEWILTGAATSGTQQVSLEIQRLSAVLSRLRGARNLGDYYRDCVVELQAMSGYDRVMLYRFLPDWSGDIVAEQVGPGFEPKYCGLRFPATDIPPQARALYERNTLRMLNDTEAMADPLVPALLPDGLPLDQSFSLLRSLSAVHQKCTRPICATWVSAPPWSSR
jgi:light-regulated signal transduction histidine kinase (bacteriophytochrome)